jgi:hypothetical protein
MASEGNRGRPNPKGSRVSEPADLSGRRSAETIRARGLQAPRKEAGYMPADGLVAERRLFSRGGRPYMLPSEGSWRERCPTPAATRIVGCDPQGRRQASSRTCDPRRDARDSAARAGAADLVAWWDAGHLCPGGCRAQGSGAVGARAALVTFSLLEKQFSQSN